MAASVQNFLNIKDGSDRKVEQYPVFHRATVLTQERFNATEIRDKVEVFYRNNSFFVRFNSDVIENVDSSVYRIPSSIVGRDLRLKLYDGENPPSAVKHNYVNELFASFWECISYSRPLSTSKIMLCR